jgi:hypothetical protein
LAAVGAAYLITSLALAVLTPLLQWILNLDQLVNRLTFPPPPTGVGLAATWSLALAAGAAVAAAVTRRNSSRIAFGLYAAFVAGAAAIRIAYAIRARNEAIGGFTVVHVGNVPEATAAIFVPPAIALILGWRLARASESGARDQAGLEAAGGYALVAIAALAAVGGLELLTPPYSVVSLPALGHAAVVVIQSLAAGSIYAVRAPGPLRAATLVMFACIGLAAALPTEVMPIALTLFLDWTYVPLSLVLVPLGTAVVAALTIWLVAVISRSIQR